MTIAKAGVRRPESTIRAASEKEDSITGRSERPQSSAPNQT